MYLLGLNYPNFIYCIHKTNNESILLYDLTPLQVNSLPIPCFINAKTTFHGSLGVLPIKCTYIIWTCVFLLNNCNFIQTGQITELLKKMYTQSPKLVAEPFLMLESFPIMQC